MPIATLQKITFILASSMVPIAFGIISVRAIHLMIRLYRVQSLILVLLTLLITFERGATGITRILLILFAILIPGLLAYIIKPLLAQATVVGEVSWVDHLAHPFLRAVSRRHQQAAAHSIREALPVWLEHGLSLRRQLTSVVISLCLTAVAVVLAFKIMGPRPGYPADSLRTANLAVSIALLMLGISTMINRQDLISQVIGLLIMDHGLFLAVVGVVSLSSLIPTFVISLFLYILITLLILVILLPELHQKSQTIEVADQNELRG